MTPPDRPFRRMSGEVTTAPERGSHVVTVHDPIDVPAWCGYCSGTGWDTETVEDATGRGVEVDYTCPVCSGTGQER